MNMKKSSWAQRLFECVDDTLRHRALLGRHDWLRAILRKPYHALLHLNRRGYTLNLGGVDVRVPPEFASKWMEDYEKEEFAHIHAWCREHPGGLFVDVGCSLGYMSCAALFSEPAIQVVAIDSDLNSLKTTGRVCRYAGLERLHRIQALVVEQSSRPVPWTEAEKATTEQLKNPAISGDPGTHRYINLDSAQALAAIPRYSLDDLLVHEVGGNRPILVKCDVEGAEYEVLAGARRLLATAKPDLLVSVHPGKLPNLGRTVDMVVQTLSESGYIHKEIAVDHEHHWLCLPRTGRM
jgi:FkbM family methyltransferase